ncbi:hypothetical protein CRENBAI_023365 [Crenichthys baileyi]|uniref:BESS domain-containing protein n=1 Tax=Crenichthys baileyi TaxID=28760 RepID=A0AAV9S3A9_9TELE
MEEEEELGISHDDTCMQTLVFKVKDHREPEPSSIRLLTENSAETENLKQEGNNDEDSGSSREDVCCKKCKGLQDTYLRERRKELESRRSGGPAGAVNRWRFSAVLSFLDPFVTAQPTTSNIDRVEETAEDLTAPAQGQETSETKETNRDNTEDRSHPPETPADLSISKFQVPAPSSSAAACTPIGRRRTVRPREEPSAVERALLEALQNQPPPPPPLTPLRVFSSNEHFLISLAPSLDRLTPHEQDLLKLQIMKVIVDHSTVVVNLEHLDPQ